MKFAKTLEDVMVPEWRTQYVQYKIGKKKIKAITCRLRTATSSPAIASLRKSVPGARSPPPNIARDSHAQTGDDLTRTGTWKMFTPRSPANRGVTKPPTSPPPQGDAIERSPLHTANVGGDYGSIESHSRDVPQNGRPPSLKLPGPMQTMPSVGNKDGAETRATGGMARPRLTSVSSPGQKSASTAALTDSPSKLLHRILNIGRSQPAQPSEHIANISEVQVLAQKEFLQWLLHELKKCEDFYVSRESEATKRFEEMREQLDIMRDRWFRAKHSIPFEEDDVEDLGSPDGRDGMSPSASVTATAELLQSRKRVPWKSVAEAIDKFTHPQPITAKFDVTAQSEQTGRDRLKNGRDYELRNCRRPVNNPPHRVAKRKLKKAYIEYYHGLEMLKSYVTINRECFRKITKKFDKASGLRTSHRFITGYVDKSYFGGTNKLDDLLNDTEALFARFFERGNRKEASLRLRSRENKTLYYPSVWRSGFCLGCAVVIGCFGVNESLRKINDTANPSVALTTSYTLQIWGGIAVILTQVLLFAVNLRVWAKNKINYSFIFEFDPRHTLNYHEFLEIPAIFGLLFAICFWFGSCDFWPDGPGPKMIHFPIIFLSLASIALALPFKIFYHHSRLWILRVLFRLILSGAFPVEFKDFWMGDIFCSLTYALGNVELFFCLYARHWSSPEHCNSSHSRVMGLFTALPGLWRLFQCFRRYYNTKMWFPHLVNGGKYGCTILYYVTLSAWRINTSNKSIKATFIFFASVNSIYTTIWDVVMDWSLFDPYAKYPFLRNALGFKTPWPYYLAMFVDPILRCSWLLYIAFARRIQHSALLSFLLAIAEVLRRFMWCIFRMENEHIGNVGAKRAYRDLPLPYLFTHDQEATEDGYSPSIVSASRTPRTIFPTESGMERVDAFCRPMASPHTPIQRTITRVGKTMTTAHMHDYERRKPEEEDSGNMSSDDEEDGDDFYERTAVEQRKQ